MLAWLKLKDGRIGTQKFLNKRHLVLFAAFFWGGGWGCRFLDKDSNEKNHCVTEESKDRWGVGV